MSVVKQVKKIGVELLMNKPLSVYDLRKLLFARFISFEKNLPFYGFLVDESSQFADPNKEEARKKVQAENKEILTELDLPFDRQISVDQGLFETVEKRLERLGPEMVEEKTNGNLNFKIPSDIVTIKDMKIGQFDYSLSKIRNSPICHIKRNRIFTPDFLMANAEECGDDLVLVENQVIFY